jgi:signal peptidase I
MPGLGQLVTGDWVGAVVCVLAVALPVPLAARLALAAPPRALCWIVVLGAAASLAAYAWSVVDALARARARDADRPPAPTAPVFPSRRRFALYGLYVLAGYLFVLAPLVNETRDRWVESYRAASASMAPALQPGDRFLVDKSVGRPGGARLYRGALVVFVYANDRRLTFIKRVVGLPGDRVEIDGAHLRVNGVEVSGPAVTAPAAAASGVIARLEHGEQGDYTVLWPRDDGASAAVASTFVVPNGQVFVLGDNRASSVDSRRFGGVPISDVKGIARQIWFSGARLGRIGRLLI